MSSVANKNSVEVSTLSVSIKTLIVGKKQFTLSMFRQLPIRNYFSFIDNYTVDDEYKERSIKECIISTDKKYLFYNKDFNEHLSAYLDFDIGDLCISDIEDNIHDFINYDYSHGRKYINKIIPLIIAHNSELNFSHIWGKVVYNWDKSDNPSGQWILHVIGGILYKSKIPQMIDIETQFFTDINDRRNDKTFNMIGFPFALESYHRDCLLKLNNIEQLFIGI